MDFAVIKEIKQDKKHDENIEYIFMENQPTVRKIYNYEYSAIRSARVSDLENNAPHYLPKDYDISNMSLGDIADEEMKLKLCPYKIFRVISRIDNKIYYDLVDVNTVPIIQFLNEKL